jgi:hypothetical protein
MAKQSGQRDDIALEECTLSQLKFKPDLDEAAARRPASKPN